MFRKENGVTLVALIITIIVLLILAGVTISMVLGDDGIIAQASGAQAAQNRATVVDQATIAYATVRAEQVARNSGVATGEALTTSNFANAMAVEMHKANPTWDVYTSGDVAIGIGIQGTSGYEIYEVTLSNSGSSTLLAASSIALSSNTSFSGGWAKVTATTY